MTGREVVELNSRKLPTRILLLGRDNKKLGEVLITYNAHGKIKERKSALYIGKTLWDENGDIPLDSSETTIYDRLGLTERVIKKYEGLKPEMIAYTYL